MSCWTSVIILKLVRNALAEWGIFIDKYGGKIQWEYVIQLQKLQDEEGLRLGNKLKKAQIYWKQQKMKVNLAAQSLSGSVADAIELILCQYITDTRISGI